jgi:hypothetical protein
MNRISRIARLENDVLDESISLATLLRQVLIIGGHASSEELRAWAQQELNGYGGPNSTLPEYRTIFVQLKADINAGPATFTGQEIGPSDFPEDVRKEIKSEIGITWSVAELQATIESGSDSHIRLGSSNMTNLARIMTRHQQEVQGSPFVNVTSVYWSVSESALKGILDRIRTRLTEFVAEVRSTMPEDADDADEPTSEQIREAVVSVIRITAGDNSPVTVTAPVAVAGQDASVTIPEDAGSRRGLRK